VTTRAGAVRLRLDGQVLHATIDRPQARNAIDHEVVDGLAATVATAREAGVKVVVLRGAGGSFCAGADLKLVRSLLDDPAALDAFLSRLGAALTELERGSWVTVAVVEGWAVAGGCEILLACDVVVAAEDARIGDVHVVRGLVPGGGASVRLPRRVPELRARWLLLSGETLSGAEAVAAGLATFAVPPAQLDAEAARVVERLSGHGAATLATVKAMLAADPAAPAGDGQAALRRELDLFHAHVAGAPDARAGLDAFVQRS
jgi:enoyl-CoA hydratase/carnithine racemase